MSAVSKSSRAASAVLLAFGAAVLCLAAVLVTVDVVGG
jgi:hypothetical protein